MRMTSDIGCRRIHISYSLLLSFACDLTFYSNSFAGLVSKRPCDVHFKLMDSISAQVGQQSSRGVNWMETSFGYLCFASRTFCAMSRNYDVSRNFRWNVYVCVSRICHVYLSLERTF